MLVGILCDLISIRDRDDRRAKVSIQLVLQFKEPC